MGVIVWVCVCDCVGVFVCVCVRTCTATYKTEVVLLSFLLILIQPNGSWDMPDIAILHINPADLEELLVVAGARSFGEGNCSHSNRHHAMDINEA